MLREYGSIEYWMSMSFDELMKWIEEINESVMKVKKEPTGIAGGSSPAAIKAYHTSGAFQRMYGPPLATYFLLPVNGSSKFSVN